MNVGDIFYLRNIVASNDILYPIVIILITIILARTTLYLLEGLLKIFHRTSMKFNQQLVSIIETPLIIIISLVGIELAVRNFLAEKSPFNNLILTISIVILTYVLMRAGSILLDFWSTRMSQTKGEEFHSEILPLTRSIVSIILTVLALVLILQVWGVEVGTLLTSLGIAGAILGLAFKQTLENIFGGISLIMDNSFKKGDYVKLEDGEIGEILEINLRSTKIRNIDSEAVIVPNGKLANSKIINLAQPTHTVRIRMPVSVAYGSDPDIVKQVLHDSLRNQPDILTMPKRMARMIGFGNSSIDFELYFYINDYEKVWDLKDKVITQVYKDLYANNIEIPFPIRTIVDAKKGQYKPKFKPLEKGKKYEAPKEEKKEE